MSPGNQETLPASNRAERAKSAITISSYVLLLGFFLFHWRLIWIWAVDVPFWDEWDEFPRQPLVSWLVEPHNEHRIVTTKLLVLLLWKLDGWDIALHQKLNFLIYGVTLTVLGFALRKSVRTLPPALIALSLLYCLSPMAFENHMWATQTHWHFLLLFLFIGTYLWFSTSDGQQSWGRILGGSASLIAAAYSLSCGMAAGLALSLLFCAFKLHRAGTHRERRNREWQQCLTGVVLVVGAIGLHFATYAPDPNAFSRSWPFEASFWSFFLALSSSADGKELSTPYGQIVGLCFLGLIVGSWVAILRARSTKKNVPSELWVPLASTVGIVASLAAIAVGRASVGIRQAFEPRYTEFTMMFIPLGVASWWWALQSRPKLRRGLLGAAGVVFAVLFILSLHQFSNYERSSRVRKARIHTLRAAYQSGQRFVVPGLYPAPLPPERLKEARALNLSFMKQIQ